MDAEVVSSAQTEKGLRSVLPYLIALEYSVKEGNESLSQFLISLLSLDMRVRLRQFPFQYRHAHTAAVLFTLKEREGQKPQPEIALQAFEHAVPDDWDRSPNSKFMQLKHWMCFLCCVDALQRDLSVVEEIESTVELEVRCRDEDEEEEKDGEKDAPDGQDGARTDDGEPRIPAASEAHLIDLTATQEIVEEHRLQEWESENETYLRFHTFVKGIMSERKILLEAKENGFEGMSEEIWHSRTDELPGRVASFLMAVRTEIEERHTEFIHAMEEYLSSVRMLFPSPFLDDVVRFALGVLPPRELSQTPEGERSKAHEDVPVALVWMKHFAKKYSPSYFVQSPPRNVTSQWKKFVESVADLEDAWKQKTEKASGHEEIRPDNPAQGGDNVEGEGKVVWKGESVYSLSDIQNAFFKHDGSEKRKTEWESIIQTVHQDVQQFAYLEDEGAGEESLETQLEQPGRTDSPIVVIDRVSAKDDDTKRRKSAGRKIEMVSKSLRNRKNTRKHHDDEKEEGHVHEESVEHVKEASLIRREKRLRKQKRSRDEDVDEFSDLFHSPTSTPRREDRAKSGGKPIHGSSSSTSRAARRRKLMSDDGERPSDSERHHRAKRFHGPLHDDMSSHASHPMFSSPQPAAHPLLWQHPQTMPPSMYNGMSPIDPMLMYLLNQSQNLRHAVGHDPLLQAVQPPVSIPYLQTGGVGGASEDRSGGLHHTHERKAVRRGRPLDELHGSARSVSWSSEEENEDSGNDDIQSSDEASVDEELPARPILSTPVRKAVPSLKVVKDDQSDEDSVDEDSVDEEEEGNDDTVPAQKPVKRRSSARRKDAKRRLVVPAASKTPRSDDKTVDESVKHKRRGFTEEETKNLIKGVKKFGRGQWKVILEEFEFEEGRSGVDLKDKWRNLTRAAQKSKKVKSVD
eukprot:TRINITY_DN1084_c0_g1_i1.p1 TRINITY_DN1084_c0_g1~~TRINITY_DN1084_c0_g1_i1.p1  ORF type:complete len:1002 (-),score=315.05 TRINITY_DN1084_c0_g1_i1:3147-5882(-)